MSAIKPGDLVYMAHRLCDCAGCREPLNIPFVVTEIVGAPSINIHCCTNLEKVIGSAPVALGMRAYNIPVSALKKIDPDIAQDDEVTDEELVA